MASQSPFRFLCPSRAFAGATQPPDDPTLAGAQRRSRWLKQLLKLHWISSALSLLGLLLFSVTGITLNHAEQIEARPLITRSTAILPAALLPELRRQAMLGKVAILPTATDAWLDERFRIDAGASDAEWAEDEVYLALPRPGGDAWLRIALEDGAVEYELTDRGWISWLNDLHKGRHTGCLWRLFIDLFALACLFFAATGLLLLHLQSAQRPSTWPLVAFGALLPALIALLFIH